MVSFHLSLCSIAPAILTSRFRGLVVNRAVGVAEMADAQRAMPDHRIPASLTRGGAHGCGIAGATQDKIQHREGRFPL